MKKEIRNSRRLSRAKRSRSKFFGTDFKPRVSVFRSLTAFYVQVVDDLKGKTLIQGNTLSLGEKNTIDGVRRLGSDLSEKCLNTGLKEVVFDRRGYKYHGKVKAFAEALRLGGLKF